MFAPRLYDEKAVLIYLRLFCLKSFEILLYITFSKG